MLTKIGVIFMKRICIFLIVVAYPVMTLGQSNESEAPVSPPYQPAVPPPSTVVYGGGGGGYNLGGGAQTAEGAAMQGMSQVISAAGQYNLDTSAAAVNMTQAESNQLRDNVQGVQTFWEMRDIGRAEREKERGPRPTPEEFARRARAGVPLALTASQIDPISGELSWPGALQNAGFQAQRKAVDGYAVRWVTYGALDYDERAQVRAKIDAMFDGLKSRIASIAPQDYVASRTFLQSLLYATTQTTL
jgi:hypothetical protein